MNEEKRSERLCKAYEDAISGIDLRLELERSKSFRKGIYFAFLVLCVAALAGIAGGLICGSVLGNCLRIRNDNRPNANVREFRARRQRGARNSL